DVLRRHPLPHAGDIRIAPCRHRPNGDVSIGHDSHQPSSIAHGDGTDLARLHQNCRVLDGVVGPSGLGSLVHDVLDDPGHLVLPSERFVSVAAGTPLPTARQGSWPYSNRSALPRLERTLRTTAP